MITVASLITSGNTERLRVHLGFYAGLPQTMSAITVAKEVLDD